MYTHPPFGFPSHLGQHPTHFLFQIISNGNTKFTVPHSKPMRQVFKLTLKNCQDKAGSLRMSLGSPSHLDVLRKDLHFPVLKVMKKYLHFQCVEDSCCLLPQLECHHIFQS